MFLIFYIYHQTRFWLNVNILPDAEILRFKSGNLALIVALPATEVSHIDTVLDVAGRFLGVLTV